MRPNASFRLQRRFILASAWAARVAVTAKRNGAQAGWGEHGLPCQDVFGRYLDQDEGTIIRRAEFTIADLLLDKLRVLDGRGETLDFADHGCDGADPFGLIANCLIKGTLGWLERTTCSQK